MNASNIPAIAGSVETNLNTGYLVGSILAFIILAYLIYALVKPEKF